jgi:hypothetical protein
MPTEPMSDEAMALRPLLAQALAGGDATALAAYLAQGSGLPGPRMNLALVGAFADAVGEVVTRPDPPVERLEALLDDWAALPLAAAPVNDPRESWPGAAVLAYGQVAVRRPDWWGDEISKLHRAASDPRWRVRELVAAALQRMLAADWPRTLAALHTWLAEADPLVIRAAAAAVAEPPLLADTRRGAEALAIQAGALAWLAGVPPAGRRVERVRTLRRALGYTVSVAAAAAPEAGFALLERLAASSDPDLQWIARENLKKTRLRPWPDRVAAVKARLRGSMGDG